MITVDSVPHPLYVLFYFIFIFNLFLKSIFLFDLFMYLAVSGLSCVAWDLSFHLLDSLVEVHGLSSWGIRA